MIPSLTIIIPAYNSEKTLAEALDSIAAQQGLGGESCSVSGCTVVGSREQIVSREGAEVAKGDKTTDGRSISCRVEASRQQMASPVVLGGEAKDNFSEPLPVNGDRPHEASRPRSGILRAASGLSTSAPFASLREIESDAAPSALRPLSYAFSLSEVEILVIDDASTDGTVRVAEEWGQRHSEWGNRLRILRNPGNLGPAASRNHGLRLAQSEWIALLDADDAWKPDRLRVGWALAQCNPEIVLWSGKVLPLSAGQETAESTCESAKSTFDRGDLPVWRAIELEELAFHNPVATSTILAKRNAIIDVGGFDASLRGPEDYDLWLRLAGKHRLAMIDWPLSYYRQRPGSLSMDDRKFLPQVIKVFAKAYGPGGALHQKYNQRMSLSWQLLAGAWMASERKAFGSAWLWFIKALWLWPRPLPCRGQYRWPRLKLMKSLIWRMSRTLVGKNGT